jgi:hypothetical protein
MKPLVSAKDGSRFAAPVPASAPLTSQEVVSTLAGTSAAPVSRPLPARFSVTLPEESLVIDDRSQLSPAQMVETKLMTRLKELSLPVSHIQMKGLVRARYFEA